MMWKQATELADDYSTYAHTLRENARRTWAAERSARPHEHVDEDKGEPCDVRKRSRHEVDAHALAFEKEWRELRAEWAPLLKGIGRGMMTLDVWANDVARAAALQPTSDIVAKAIAIQPRRLVAGPMIDGYVKAALPTVLRSAEATWRALTKRDNLPDPAEEMALGAVHQTGAGLVEGITDRTQTQIQEAVARGIQTGSGIPRIARAIRQGVGLTPRDAAAVERYEERLIKEGRPAAQVKRMTTAYRKRKLKERAETIARTEVVRARNIGQDLAWELAVAEGELEPTEKREWIAKDPCPICKALDGTTAKLGQPFRADGHVVMRPPAHPRCKCSMAMAV